jgi:hypothetical protein
VLLTWFLEEWIENENGAVKKNGHSLSLISSFETTELNWGPNF